MAYANFAIAAEYLMADYYTRLLEAGLVHGSVKGGVSAPPRRNKGRHRPGARRSSSLMPGGPAPLPEDFELSFK